MKSRNTFFKLVTWSMVLSGWIILFGCSEPPQPSSLVVLDAHGQPPDSGYVLLAQPQILSNGASILGWTIVSDTLEWDPKTGEIVPAESPPDGAHWMIHSPNPFPTGTWRNVTLETSNVDSCVLPVEVPWTIHLRAQRNIGLDISGYDIEFSSDAEPTTPLIQTSTGQGSFHFQGLLSTHAFPIKLTLSRLPKYSEEDRIVTSHEFEFCEINEGINCHWEDGNVDEL